jgi:hypothetical protein
MGAIAECLLVKNGIDLWKPVSCSVLAHSMSGAASSGILAFPLKVNLTLAAVLPRAPPL